jgi:uncharacterized protein
MTDTVQAQALHPALHLFRSGGAPHLFLANGSQIYAIDEEVREALATAVEDDRRLEWVLEDIGVLQPALIGGALPALPPIRSLSLAIAQACNLACTYCYASGGSFGGDQKKMSADVAERSIDLLLSEASTGERVTIVFLGGEPLANRQVLRHATEYARRRGAEAGIATAFAITTNATLVDDSDAAFFAEHRFSVTVSIDGSAATHDMQRPFRDGRPSYARVLKAVDRLVAHAPRLGLHARVTVLPGRIALAESLNDLAVAGFTSVGFSPMLRSPSGRAEMTEEALGEFLGQMIDCAQDFEAAALRAEPHPFANARTAMVELHKGTHRPYPCGAGASYLGVSADGGLYACHRFNEDPAGSFGSVQSGRSVEVNKSWLDERHVDHQEPCRSCWARYLCGGGCHHEVIARGRHACDYIRGWLDHCLGMYSRIRAERSDYLDRMCGWAPPHG